MIHCVVFNLGFTLICEQVVSDYDGPEDLVDVSNCIFLPPIKTDRTALDSSQPYCILPNSSNLYPRQKPFLPTINLRQDKFATVAYPSTTKSRVCAV